MGRIIARLRISIEVNRRELLRLGEIKPLTDPDVIKLSQQLDIMLNEYEGLKREYLSSNGLDL
ncbi:aspartyl-phosphate phosphatase Spo0E family protein [Desulfitobacterium sp.]|uniref:aspartyl-phosphate phosphatase Spo0E family protein n=1 Tax=Desulfitobacterium sp. TaxID=49981 RepID=UPI002B220831|nr:aspartyl-phosphate phosphatase Spo0E family protein [Desulfitobacterium sp.]MEA4902793.1 aspartyl-phosphate phosphatase Spo0E family protein [Desulfitobacterium sp.]